MTNEESEQTKRRDSRKRRRTIRVWVKRVLLAAVAIGAVAAIVIAMLPKPVPVDTATVSQGPMEVTVDAEGKTRVKNRYTVGAPVSGTMPRIDLQPGDAIEVGQVLVTLVPLRSPLLNPRARAEAEAQLSASLAGQRQASARAARAKVALEQAKTEFARAEKLAKGGVAPEVRLEQARYQQRAARDELAATRFAVSVAEQQVAQARAALGILGRRKTDQLDITAPASGTVLRVIRRDEGVVNAGAPIIEIGDLGSLEVVVDVLTRDAVDIQTGTPVRIERWGRRKALAGRVRRVEPAAETRVSALGVEEQRVDVVIDFAAEREQFAALGDGFRVEARIVIWKSPSAVQVPASAVFRRGESWAAFVVRGETAKLVPVKIGRRNPSHVQVLEGLKLGERVVVHPSDRVKDGVDVAERGK